MNNKNKPCMRRGTASGIVLLLILLGSLAHPAAQARVYKWVDADGRTHYSQTPPPVQSSPPDVKHLDVNTRPANTVLPTPFGNALRCGNILLPQQREDQMRFLAAVNAELPGWEEQERNAKQEYNRLAHEMRMAGSADSQRSWFSARLDDEKRKWDEASCAVAWGRQQLEAGAESREAFLREHAAREQELAELERRQEACVPVHRRGQPLIGEEAEQVYRCRVELAPRIQELRQELRRDSGTRELLR